ncbi:DUF4267 domain-containing protein [Streptomyces sp. SID14478]|nr:DUF4267 domain-containing protein [Streptomyces sp. SID14478]
MPRSTPPATPARVPGPPGETAAAGHGVPAEADGDRAYLTVKGLRDFTLALLGLALLAFAGARVGAWFMLLVALIPPGDMLMALRHGGTKALAYGVRFATAVVVLISVGLPFAVRTRRGLRSPKCPSSCPSSTRP